MTILRDLPYEDAQNLPDPKHIWLNGTTVIVYTEDDIPPLARQISPYAFRLRFTDAEMTSILALAYAGDASVRKLLLKLQTTDFIDLDNTEVVNGCQYLVSQSAITEERKVEILS